MKRTDRVHQASLLLSLSGALLALSGCGPVVTGGGGEDTKSEACAATFGGGAYHDTYFRDAFGGNHLYIGASAVDGSGGVLPSGVVTTGGHQVCDYAGAISDGDCAAIPATSGGATMVLGAGPYCQQFTDGSHAMLDSIPIARSVACAPTYAGGSYHDTYFRDASGTNHLYTGASAVDGSGGTLPAGVMIAGGFQVCDYDGSIPASACPGLPATSGGSAMVLGSGPYCQQFTDASHTVLDSIVAEEDVVKSEACAPSFGGGAYHDTYFRDASGTNHLYIGASAVDGSGGVLPSGVVTAGGFQVCDYDGTISDGDCAALPATSGGATMVLGAGPYCQQFTDASHGMLDSIVVSRSVACDATFAGNAYHDTYFRDASGTNHLYIGASAVDGSGGTLPAGVVTTGGFQVCDYSGVVSPSACLGLAATAGGAAMINGAYCQQFTDATSTVLDSVVIGKPGSVSMPCAPSFGGGSYHDTYFRDASGTNHLYTGASAVDGSGGTLPSGVVTAGGYQVCDYTGAITDGACLGLPATSGGGAMILGAGPYCQQFTDATHGTLESISIYKSGGCAPTFAGGLYHDTYFRDTAGVDHLYTGASAVDGSGGHLSGAVTLAGGYQVCDYAGSISVSACLGLPATTGGGAMLLGSPLNCQQFTDSSFDTLDSILAK